MAASQVECLEEDNVNVQLSESQPQFSYCERQRLALEALMAKGSGAFHQCVKREGLRLFLSGEEVRRIHATLEEYRHGEVAEGEEQDSELGDDPSLTYWPLKSDAQAPYLALGWPEMGMWKGITRAKIYTQPPTDNMPAIKEVVRTLLQSAKQVIAVVMDSFTDVDVFLDIVEAASNRRVAAYILLDQRNLPQFITMAEGTGTNLRLMDNIRVRVLFGCSFCSRDGKKVTGDVKERFLLVDGETVVTGSYSFTWADARLDRNLVTVLTGQVVDSFDREFRTLYAASRPLQRSDFAPPLPLLLTNGYSPSPLLFETPGALEPGWPLALWAAKPAAGSAPRPSKSVTLRHVATRRTVAPAAVSGGSRDPLPRPPEGLSDARPSFRQAVTSWRGARGLPAGGTAEAAPALSDILRNVRRARLASGGLSAAPPKASKSMWDLSALSQLSNSSYGSSLALDQLELGEDAKSRLMKSQVTPAATLMRHRVTLKDEEVPGKPRAPRTFYPLQLAGFASPLLPGHARQARPSPRPWASPGGKPGEIKPAGE
ncbi:protein FAM83E-like [Heterodontus francisci]|uniref:protein FAM83E-like n=1 Tax=Heterodontus francisci TaxID=7792 RepID=UPI00355B4C4D